MQKTKKELSQMFSDAYQEALREGCDHDSAFDCAMEEITECLDSLATPDKLEIPVMPLLKGLGIQFSPDGTWLSFKDTGGNSSVIRLENLADASGKIINTTIQKWCADMRGENVPGAALPKITKAESDRLLKIAFVPDGSKRDYDPSDTENQGS